MTSKSTYLPNLTPLRGLAAIAVVLFHKVTLYSSINPDKGGFDKLIDGIFNKGSLGVNFFFTLSGFLITYLLVREVESKGKFDALRFLIRRALRIWPVYIVVALCGFVIMSSDGHNPLYFATFLSNFDEILNGAQSGNHVLTVLWSVSIEEQFYIAWAVILGLTALKPKFFPHVFAAVIVATVAFRWMNMGDERVLYYHTLSVISDMAIGGMLAIAVLRDHKLVQSIRNMAKWQIMLIYLIGVGFILTHNMIMKDELYVVDRLVTGVFWAFIICEQCIAANSIVKSSSIPFLEYLGKISYGIYAYHLIIFFVINDVVQMDWQEFMPTDLIVNTTIVLLFTVVAASISYEVLEKPLLKIKDRFR